MDLNKSLIHDITIRPYEPTGTIDNAGVKPTFYRPKQIYMPGYTPHTRFDTIKEWLRCIISPKHAETTWLRITEEDEERWQKNAKRILIVLFVLAFMAWALAGYRYYENKQLKKELQQEKQLQLIIEST